MKYFNIDRFNTFKLNETGEANLEPYEILNVVSMDTMYGTYINHLFETESGIQYDINFLININDTMFAPDDIEECEIVDDVDDFYESTLAISFFVYTGDPFNFTLNDMFNVLINGGDTVITNRGEMYRIMATLVKLYKDYIKENPNIKYVFMGGQEGSKKGVKKQRENLYLKYFKNLHPNAEYCDIYVHAKKTAPPTMPISPLLKYL